MTCHNCKVECRKFGKTRKGQQRYRCCQCYKTYSEPRNEYLGGMYTSPKRLSLLSSYSSKVAQFVPLNALPESTKIRL